MAERRKGRKKMEKENPDGDKITKEQKNVRSWLRKNIPTKKTKFMHSHAVNYFVASKAVDGLLNDSPWSKAKAKEGSQLVFEYREQCVDYLDHLLRLKAFHRAKKIPVAEKEKKKKKNDKPETETEDEKCKDKKGEKDKKKKKRKIRLDMHMDQIFLDSNDAYVWLYDPTPWYYWLGGTGIVLGIIALCLFPLWPTEARKGVYYLSVAAAAFLVIIIALAVIKYILFAFLFVFSRGKLFFWIFPNLTEDVGFFESFWPIYVYTYTGQKKEKESDDESEDESDDDRKDVSNEKSGEEDTAREGDQEGSDSGESRGSTGKDFEMVDSKDNVEKDKTV